MDICRKCGKPLGSSGECEECLEFLVRQGKESISEEDAKRADSDAQRWLSSRGKSAPRKLFKLVELLAMMIRDYFKGEYKAIPWTSIASVTFALIYIINIIDLIPDFILGIGWTDDLAVTLLIIPGVRHDLDNYCRWKGLNREDYGLPPKKGKDS